MAEPNITEEMIDKCAHAYAAADGYDWVDVSQLWQGRYRRQAAAGLGAALAGYTVTPAAEPNAWRVEVTVPLRLPVEQRHELFSAVCSAVADWEPAPGDRDGWDADVSGHPVYDEFASGASESSGGETTVGSQDGTEARS